MPFQVHPDKWGEDSLTAFFNGARSNSYAAFANLKFESGQLIELDEIFDNAIAQLVKEPDPLPVGLFIRCHSAYRAACQLVMSGLLPEFYAVARVSLEYGLYGYHLRQHPELQETWLRRNEDDESRRRVRRAFQPATLLKEVSASDSLIGKVASLLYEGCIDYGAHPNEGSLTSNSAIRQLEDGVELSVNYLAADGPVLRSALRVCAQVAVCSLDIMRLAMPSALDDSALRARVEAIRQSPRALTSASSRRPGAVDS